MPNTIRELSEIAIKNETTWGEAPSGSAMRLEVDAGEWLRDNITEFRDEMVRNVFARDHHSIPVVGVAEGTLSGAVTPIMSWYFFDGFLGGTEAKADLENDSNTDTNLDIHEFTIGNLPRTYTVQQSDNLTDELFLGMMPSSYTLRFNSGEGALEWETELIGKGKVFPGTAKTVVENTKITETPPQPIVGSMIDIDINGNTTGKVMDMEIVFSRDVELTYGADNTIRPNIRRANAPRATFRATLEFQIESDIQKYSNDAGNASDAQAGAVTFDEPNATYFNGNIDYWHIRASTDRATTTAKTPVPTTAISDGGNTAGTLGDDLGTGTNTDRFAMDIYFDRVTYGSDPVQVDRSEQSATFEFRGTALYSTTNSRLGVFRVFNAKDTKYTTDDVA